MAFDPLARDSVIQNLYDAGLSQDVVEQFLVLMEQNGISQQLRFLAVERSGLLDSIHRQQKNLDCLDYLMYQLQKASLSK